jgi:hypothetical protein
MLVFYVSHVGLKIPLFFNVYIYIYIITILGLGVKISHVSKQHDIIGGMSFATHKLSLDWFIVLPNPMVSCYKSWMIFEQLS